MLNLKKGQVPNIVCLHCHEEGDGKFGETHRCLWEVLDHFANALIEVMEHNCGNSGLNWQDYYNHLKKEHSLEAVRKALVEAGNG